MISEKWKGPYASKTKHFSDIWLNCCRFDQSWSLKYTMLTKVYKEYRSLPFDLKNFFQDVCLSMDTSCVNFIKIAPLLRVVSIQVKIIGLWGVPLPPRPIWPISNTSLFHQNTHFGFYFIEIGWELLKLSCLQGTKYSVQSTGYGGLTLTPPKIDEFVF